MVCDNVCATAHVFMAYIYIYLRLVLRSYGIDWNGTRENGREHRDEKTFRFRLFSQSQTIRVHQFDANASNQN